MKPIAHESQGQICITLHVQRTKYLSQYSIIIRSFFGIVIVVGKTESCMGGIIKGPKVTTEKEGEINSR